MPDFAEGDSPLTRKKHDSFFFFFYGNAQIKPFHVTGCFARSWLQAWLDLINAFIYPQSLPFVSKYV